MGTLVSHVGIRQCSPEGGWERVEIFTLGAFLSSPLHSEHLESTEVGQHLRPMVNGGGLASHSLHIHLRCIFYVHTRFAYCAQCCAGTSALLALLSAGRGVHATAIVSSGALSPPTLPAHCPQMPSVNQRATLNTWCFARVVQQTDLHLPRFAGQSLPLVGFL